MTSITRSLFANWPLKLTALGLATVLYMGVTISESTQVWTGPVPIEVRNVPERAALLSAPGVVDRIEFLAPDSVIDTLSSDSFRASVDLSAVEPRAGPVAVEVPVDVFPQDPRVRVVGVDPSGATVHVDEVVTRTMTVAVDHGPLPEGIELGPVSVEPARVTIQGASSLLQNVRSVAGHFVVDASGANIDEDMAVEALDELGATVPGVTVQPATVRVEADAAHQLAYATLPVIPRLVGEPAHGRRVDNVSVLPATVTVSGENPAVRQLESIATEAVDIEGASVELVADVGLALPEEVTSAGDERVTVLVTFTEALGSRTFEIGTALTGAQPGYRYQVGEPSVSVIVSGPVRQLDELAVGEISVEIPVAALEVGVNEVSPVVRTPRGTSAVRVIPTSVRVTVEPGA